MAASPNLIRRRLLGSLAAGLAAPLAVRAQGSPVKLRYQLDWRYEAGVAAYVLALRKGYFAQEGLDVTLNVGNGAASTVTRIASGVADMGTGDMNSLAEFAANNPQLPAQAVMLMYEQTPAAVFSLKKTGIRRPADLRGRQLAAPVNDGARRVFPLFAVTNGLDPDKDVSWLSVEPALRETMLARGQVEAITGYMASGLISLQKLGVSPDDIQVMRYADHGVNLYGNAIMASTSFIREQPKAVAGFLRAVTRALREVAADRPAAIATLKQQDPLVDTRIETQRLEIILNQEIGVAATRRDGVGNIDIARYQKSIEALAKPLGFKSVPSAASLVNTSFLPPLAERRVFAD